MIRAPAATCRQSPAPSGRAVGSLAGSGALDVGSPLIRSAPATLRILVSAFFPPSVFGPRISDLRIRAHPLFRRRPSMEALGVVAAVLANHFKKARDIGSVRHGRPNGRNAGSPRHLQFRIRLD